MNYLLALDKFNFFHEAGKKCSNPLLPCKTNAANLAQFDGLLDVDCTRNSNRLLPDLPPKSALQRVTGR